jgi:hypothetical protein
MEIQRDLPNGGFMKLDRHPTDDKQVEAFKEVFAALNALNPADINGLIIAVRMKEECDAYDIVAFGGRMNFIQEALIMMLQKLTTTIEAVHGKEGMVAELDARSTFSDLLNKVRRKS